MSTSDTPYVDQRNVVIGTVEAVAVGGTAAVIGGGM
jgi:hypothetical protein